MVLAKLFDEAADGLRISSGILWDLFPRFMRQKITLPAAIDKDFKDCVDPASWLSDMRDPLEENLARHGWYSTEPPTGSACGALWYRRIGDSAKFGMCPSKRSIVVRIHIG